MPGVRLRHKSLTNCVYTIEHPLRPLQLPHDCFVCGQQHKVKTYHLGLDEVGSVIVSTGVLDRLKEIPFIIGKELTIESEVKDPPPITVGLNSAPKKYRVVKYKGKDS